MRFNPHFHAIILEGGIDQTGSFHHIPIKDLSAMTEIFRRRLIAFLVEKGLLNQSFAQNLLSWKHSGFSIDNSVLIRADDQQARESLSQYASTRLSTSIARHPVALPKIIYVPSKGNVLFRTRYNEYFGENLKLIPAIEFIALLTAHIPPKNKHLIRYYGL